MTVVVVTGHRPSKLRGLEVGKYRPMVNLAKQGLVELQASKVYSGMAWGWDWACAQGCVELGIPFVAVIPFPGQEDPWTWKMKKFYHRLLKQAQSQHVVCDAYYQGVMLERNRWMLDRPDVTNVLALWNGEYRGGTAHAVNYAYSKGLPVKNMYPQPEV